LSTNKSQFANIQLGVKLLFQPHQLVECRVRLTSGPWRGFYFTDHGRLADVVNQLDQDPRVTSIYYVINPVKANLLVERAKCTCKICVKGKGGLLVDNPTDIQVESILTGPSQHLTGNEDVDSLNWLFIDVDTVRAKGMEHESSTKKEKAAACGVAKSVLAFLDEKQWPNPIFGDSGNGFHILAKIKMLNMISNTHMLLDCLKVLSKKFNCEAAHIDDAVFNPARLTRAYGSTTRKGTNTPERLFRYNKLVEPSSPIEEVPLEKIISLGSEIPISSRRTNDIPELDPKFDPADWIKWYEDQGAFSIEEERDTSGLHIMVTDTCLNAGHRHTGSTYSGFVVGDSFGYHCFSDDCPDVTIGTIFKILRETLDENGKQKYKPYLGPIFKDDGLEEFILEFADVLEKTETSIEQAQEIQMDKVMEDSPSDKVEEKSTTRDALDIECNQQATDLLSIILHHPAEVWEDGFIFYVKRVKDKLGFNNKTPKKVGLGEVGVPTLGMPIGDTMFMLLKFIDVHQKLPDKEALTYFIQVNDDPTVKNNKFKDEVIHFVNNLPDRPISTFDHTAQQFLKKLDLRHEYKAWRAAYNHFLFTEGDIQGARKALRKHWNISTAQDTTFEQGSWQENTESILADFERDLRGDDDSRKMMLGFPIIDNSGANIGLDGDRYICLCGPSNNRKTTAVLSIALNLAIQGHHGLFFAGEHQKPKLLKKLTLQLSHFFRDDEEIGHIPGLNNWEGLKRTATEEDFGHVKTLLTKLRLGKIVPGHLEPQNIDALSRGDDDKVGALLAYAEATWSKYQWTYIVIDPIDTVMPVGGDSNRDGQSIWDRKSEVIERLLRFSRNAFGGRGCAVFITAQYKSDAAREIQGLQEKNVGPDRFDDAIASVLRRDSNIQTLTTIIQKCDLCIGIATLTKNGDVGLMVRGRDREGGRDWELEFEVDKDSNYMMQSKRERSYKVAAAESSAPVHLEQVDQL
jgi:hypothetical protein